MTTTNRALIQRFFEEAYNQGDLQIANELVAADYTNHDPAPGEASCREGLKASIAYLHRAFADLQVTINDQVSEGDKVTTRFTLSGVQTGEYAGIPPSGASFAIQATTIHRICDGQIVESWFNWDLLGLLQQLRCARCR
jgi:steroid delta-isomerase-like uncharacterized protein